MEEKDKIIEQIEDKLFKEGFYKTTMDEVASELGMSKKTIYKFFPSKDDLVMAIAKHFMNVMKSKIVPALNTDKNAIEKLAELINILATASDKISTKRMEEMKRHFPEIWNEIDRFRTKMMFENITKIINQGKDEGLFIDYPTSIIMTILVVSVRSIVNPDFILNNSFSIIEGARFTFKIIIGGIVTEKGSKVFNQTINKI
ncbi:MAG: TetR/AcrR family transcriptional regulator [Ignavibacteriales bacterium]|jgi:AcrR family transcriptional regulator|nr:TetR/AcrR family transcriptional regulator [Ignavibacteriales bacterium]